MSSIPRLFVVCGLATGLISVSRADGPVQHHFDGWTVTIQPGSRGSGLRDLRASPIRLVSQSDSPQADATNIPPAPEALPNPTGTTGRAPMLVQSYSQVYNSIPFSRAEYEANPSYRHDATMEFLFGQMRQTVIQRGTTVIRNGSSMMPYSYSMPYSPYGFNSYFYPFYNVPIYRPYNLW